MQSQDTLTLNAIMSTGSGGLGVSPNAVFASLTSYYEDAVGFRTRYIDLPTLKQYQSGNMFSIPIGIDQPFGVISSGAIEPIGSFDIQPFTNFPYSGTQNSYTPNVLPYRNEFKYYAILGATVQNNPGLQEFYSVFVTSPATGNVRVGFDASQFNSQGAEYFLDMSEKSLLPTIPVVRGSEFNQTICEIQAFTNGNITPGIGEIVFDESFLVTWFLAELDPSFVNVDPMATTLPTYK